ncbi:RluA family pseudouridine synthase [Candidatus Anaplasma sp. TIGMIC]|uniref:RluA family pseudouridine synthase n=1 Tax=Candidatus Anaplasma sp. TIGMIC TaxID=3020713 RepID=UPI00232CF6FD|nr:RluA family pseudouridine synthase [Candidatus Anaplasma sp. TIGMIC]MDB1135387.1 RluA family pseudouridine synthase [Candidatus Anaplasma sp. TIGMIC]
MSINGEYSVDAEHDGSRLDRYIRSVLPGLTQSFIERLLRRGEIRLNNKKVASSTRVKLGDVVIVSNVAGIATRAHEVQEVRCDTLLRLIIDNVIYKDDNIVAINKPVGVSVQGGSKVRVSLCDLLEKIIPGETLHIVHRLDKDTSGVLILARRKSVARVISEQLRCRKIYKDYLAVTRGVPGADSGEITIPVFYKRKQGCVEGITEKDARTVFSVVKANEIGAVVLLKPVTGRKHQLRIHMAQSGCPIVGDEKYCGTEAKGELHLHALKITLELFGCKIAIVAPIPGHMVQTINTLFGELPREVEALL